MRLSLTSPEPQPTIKTSSPRTETPISTLFEIRRRKKKKEKEVMNQVQKETTGEQVAAQPI